MNEDSRNGLVRSICQNSNNMSVVIQNRFDNLHSVVVVGGGDFYVRLACLRLELSYSFQRKEHCRLAIQVDKAENR